MDVMAWMKASPTDIYLNLSVPGFFGMAERFSPFSLTLGAALLYIAFIMFPCSL